MCSRRCASSLLALSALLLAGCGSTVRPAEVRAVFARHGIDLAEGAQPRAADPWRHPFARTATLLVGPEDDPLATAVIAVVVYPSGDEAERDREQVAPTLARSFERVARRGNVLVFWDKESRRSERARLAAALEDLP